MALPTRLNDVLPTGLDTYSWQATVTPHDTNTFLPTRALFIGGSAAATTVTVTPAKGGNDVVYAVGAGQSILLPIAVVAVKDTGTDATPIVALW